MVHPERFERPTYGSVIRCSIQLSYGCVKELQKANSRDSPSGVQVMSFRGFDPTLRGKRRGHDTAFRKDFREQEGH